jgi:hypothetical protein
MPHVWHLSSEKLTRTANLLRQSEFTGEYLSFQGNRKACRDTRNPIRVEFRQTATIFRHLSSGTAVDAATVPRHCSSSARVILARIHRHSSGRTPKLRIPPEFYCGVIAQRTYRLLGGATKTVVRINPRWDWEFGYRGQYWTSKRSVQSQSGFQFV